MREGGEGGHRLTRKKKQRMAGGGPKTYSGLYAEAARRGAMPASPPRVGHGWYETCKSAADDRAAWQWHVSGGARADCLT